MMWWSLFMNSYWLYDFISISGQQVCLYWRFFALLPFLPLTFSSLYGSLINRLILINFQKMKPVNLQCFGDVKWNMKQVQKKKIWFWEFFMEILYLLQNIACADQVLRLWVLYYQLIGNYKNWICGLFENIQIFRK